ncbi:head GIN domain-containing protein [Draconibacterium sp.]
MGPSIKGNGNVVEQTRKVKDFSKINVSRGMNVYISQGEFTKIVVKADENLLDAIETKIEGDELIIRATENIRSATSKKVYITVPNLEEIEASSGSNIFSETKLVFKNLEVSTSSGSNVTLEINSEKTDFSTSSGSNLILRGTANSFKGKASSGSNIKAEELTTENCESKASSGANIWITAKTDFSGDVSSGANIFVYGNPKNSNIEKSSGGNVLNK